MPSVFKSLADMEENRRLFTLAWGLPKVGKTTFLVGNKERKIPSWPKPIFMLNYDLGLEELLGQIDKPDRIGVNFVDLVADRAEMDDREAAALVDKSEQALNEAIHVISKEGTGTVSFDTISSHWDVIQLNDVHYREDVKRNRSDNKPLRFEYGPANARYRQNVMGLKQIPHLNCVMFEYAKELYDDNGKPLGRFKPHGQQWTEHMAPYVLHLYTDGEGKDRKYMGKLTFSRTRPELVGVPMQNWSYQRLYNLLFEEDE